MSSSFTEIRSQSTQVDSGATLPTHTEDVYAGRMFFDTSTGRLYCYDGDEWRYIQGTTTSTSTTSTSTTSSSTSTTSTSTTSTSTTSTSISTSSTSTSTTLM